MQLRGAGNTLHSENVSLTLSFPKENAFKWVGQEDWRIVAWAGEKRAGSGSSKTKRIGREIQNANAFKYFQKQTRTQNLI